MTDFVTMQNRIAREVYYLPTANTSGKASEIRDAIQSAINFFEPELFWFNEQQATSATASGVEYYVSPDDYVQMYALSIARTDSMWETLEPLSLDQIEERNSSSRQGRPTAYCSFNEQFRLSPIPDNVYDLRLSYMKKLPEVFNDSDTNAWLTEAEEMIRAKAKAILYLDVGHDIEQASAQDAVASMWFRNLQKRTGQWIGTEQIRPALY